ncbi:MAG: HEAT repeat domain-containing protein [Candidatus Zixiibacteriota bacterium]
MAFSLFAIKEEKIKEQYLIASTGDVRIYDKQEKALNKLASYGKDAAIYLIGQFDRTNVRRIRTIEKGLIMIGDDAVEPLLAKLSSGNPKHAVLAAKILGEIGDDRALLSLMMASRGQSPALRAKACYALGEIREKEALDNLLLALDDSVASVRRSAAIAAGKIGDSKALDKLIEKLYDNDYSVRYSASYAIISIGDTNIVPELEKRLANDTTMTKYHIIETIGQIGAESSRENLLSLTESPNHLTRGFAYKALSNYRGIYEIANTIKKGMDDNSTFVRQMSEEALYRIAEPPEEN